MRIKLFILTVFAIIGCIVCYAIGFNSGVKQSHLETKNEQQTLVIVTLGGYKAAEATNWTKVQSLLSTELLAFTRDYEHRFGLSTGTNTFDRRFAEAKEIADRVEKQMVPVASGLQKALGTNFKVEMGK
jgi:hypothetical protein